MLGVCKMGEMEGTEDIPRAGPAWSQLCRQTRYGGSAPTGRHEVGQDKLASSKDYCSLPGLVFLDNGWRGNCEFQGTPASLP